MCELWQWTCSICRFDTNDMLTSLKVSFSSNDGSFCNLPPSLSKKYASLINARGTPAVIQLRWSGLDDPLFVCWLGGISQIDDVIELPAAQFEQFRRHNPEVTVEAAYAHVEDAT